MGACCCAKENVMAKTRTAPAVTLGDLAAVDKALELIAAAQADAGRLAAEVEERIAAIKADYDVRVKSLLALADEERGLVEAFAEIHPELFEPVRHQDLPHGRIGYRRAVSVTLKNKAETVVAALESRGLNDAVIVRKSPNKDVLAAYDDETLAAVGARKTVRDQFYIDIRKAG
jgi:phage host-nuclease inhibitor protein Gam